MDALHCARIVATRLSEVPLIDDPEWLRADSNGTQPQRLQPHQQDRAQRILMVRTHDRPALSHQDACSGRHFVWFIWDDLLTRFAAFPIPTVHDDSILLASLLSLPTAFVFH